MQSRRRWLGTVAGLMGVAGCLGTDEGDQTGNAPSGTESVDSDPEWTPTPSDWLTTADVSQVAVRKATYRYFWPGSTAAIVRPDLQFVVATVRGTPLPPPESVSLSAGSESYSHGLGTVEGFSDPRYPDTVDGRDPYLLGNRTGGSQRDRATLVFPVPCPLDATSPEIRLSGERERRFPLPDGAVSALGTASPTFELESFDVPATVTAREPFALEATVTNTSTVDGRFLGVVTVPTPNVTDDDEAAVVAGAVPAGETATISGEMSRYDPQTARATLTGYVSATAELTIRTPATSTDETTHGTTA